MSSKKRSYTTVDEYIGQYPQNIQQILTELRAAIHAAVPHLKEKISWQMPTFYDKQNVVHFAVFKHHIGLYPGAQPVEEFASRLAEYKTSKGAIQFPLDKPIPLALVQEITLFSHQLQNNAN